MWDRCKGKRDRKKIRKEGGEKERERVRDEGMRERERRIWVIYLVGT